MLVPETQQHFYHKSSLGNTSKESPECNNLPEGVRAHNTTHVKIHVGVTRQTKVGSGHNSAHATTEENVKVYLNFFKRT